MAGIWRPRTEKGNYSSVFYFEDVIIYSENQTWNYNVMDKPFNYFKYTPRKGPMFFTCNTDEYEVKLIDLEKMKIVKTIKRGYKRVKVTKETESFTTSATLPGKDGSIISTPKQEFLHDIQAIYFYDNMLWVFTSTVDKEKGVMIDLYDEAGKFMRSLYMKFPQWASHYQVHQQGLIMDKGYLYSIERDLEENPIIVKYKL